MFNVPYCFRRHDEPTVIISLGTLAISNTRWKLQTLALLSAFRRVPKAVRTPAFRVFAAIGDVNPVCPWRLIWEPCLPVLHTAPGPENLCSVLAKTRVGKILGSFPVSEVKGLAEGLPQGCLMWPLGPICGILYFAMVWEFNLVSSFTPCRYVSILIAYETLF